MFVMFDIYLTIKSIAVSLITVAVLLITMPCGYQNYIYIYYVIMQLK